MCGFTFSHVSVGVATATLTISLYFSSALAVKLHSVLMVDARGVAKAFSWGGGGVEANLPTDISGKHFFVG